MKRFRDFSHKKSLEGLKTDRAIYHPTTKSVREWFAIINNKIFSGGLKSFDKVIVKSTKENWALFSGFDETGHTMLEINRAFDNEKLFVEILAHEMVHLWQYLHDEPVNHGPTFRRWREKFLHVGLTLHRTF